MSTQSELLVASSKANEVIEAFGLKSRIKDGHYTRIDPAFLASLAEIPVMYRRLEKLLGGFIREGDTAGILVNHDRSRGLVHMTCAHELGHFFLGHDSTADDKLYHDGRAALVERLADQFAYSLLAPRWLIAATMRVHGWHQGDLSNPSVIYQMSLRLGTSYTAMVWSLYRTSVILLEQATALQSIRPKTLKVKALGGQPLDDPRADVWVLDAADRDQILEPGYGDKFVVRLPNHAGSGHIWSADELQSDGFVLEPFLADARETPKSARHEIVIGGGPTFMNYSLEPPPRYRSRDSGEEGLDQLADRRRIIQLKESAPWSGEWDGLSLLSFSTEFEPTNDGFTVSERAHRVNRVKVNP